MSLSPDARDSLIVGVSIVALWPAFSYTLDTLAWCVEGVLWQRDREARARLTVCESPVEAEPEGTCDDAGSAWLGSATGAPGEGPEDPRSTSADEASGAPPRAGE